MVILGGSVGSHALTYTRNKDFIRPSGRNHGYYPPFGVRPSVEKGNKHQVIFQPPPAASGADGHHPQELPSFPTMPFPDLQRTC